VAGSNSIGLCATALTLELCPELLPGYADGTVERTEVYERAQLEAKIKELENVSPLVPPAYRDALTRLTLYPQH